VGYAEVISLPEVRASKPWKALRQQLHERFDQWLDALEQQWPAPPSTLPAVTALVWNARQQLTGSLTEAIGVHGHRGEHDRTQANCPGCERVLRAQAFVGRTVETMVGPVQLERPSFYCRVCHAGTSPLDAVVGASAGRMPRDVQQAAVALAREGPYETASTLLGQLTGMTVSSERMHTFPHQVATGLSVVEVAPSREEIDRHVGQGAAGRFRRPVLVLGIDGAYVPSRPERARGRRPGPARHRARWARWRHEWREAKGFRFSLLDGERIVHVRSWHQVYSEDEVGKALQ
jgi:hypothetical protein